LLIVWLNSDKGRGKSRIARDIVMVMATAAVVFLAILLMARVVYPIAPDFKHVIVYPDSWGGGDC
jgi:hypothetical protein